MVPDQYKALTDTEQSVLSTEHIQQTDKRAMARVRWHLSFYCSSGTVQTLCPTITVADS